MQITKEPSTRTMDLNSYTGYDGTNLHPVDSSEAPAWRWLGRLRLVAATAVAGIYVAPRLASYRLGVHSMRAELHNGSVNPSDLCPNPQTTGHLNREGAARDSTRLVSQFVLPSSTTPMVRISDEQDLQRRAIYFLVLPG